MTRPPPLCLVGMSGVGKSYWAKRLAAAGFRRHDCDDAIGARLVAIVRPRRGEDTVHALGRWMGMPWSEGYAEREARYLAFEEEVTRAALTRAVDSDRRDVIDTTGSVIYLSDSLRSDLRAACRVVYLRAEAARHAAMLQRYLDEPKPVVWGGLYAPEAGEEPAATLARCYGELLRTRDERYLALAHTAIDAAVLEARPPDVNGFLRSCGVD